MKHDAAVPVDLTTSRLRLVRLSAEHLDDLVALDADPEVMRFINGGEPTPRERYETDYLARMTAYDDKPYGFLAVYEAQAFVGWFHLRPSVVDASMLELGYRLRRASWGRGFATEGSRALLRHAFDTLGEAYVDACAMPANVASTGVMMKCGMKRVGSFVHPRASVVVDRYLVRADEVVLG